MPEKWIRYELNVCYEPNEHNPKWRRVASERVGKSSETEQEAINQLKINARDKKTFDANLKAFIDLGHEPSYRITRCEVEWITDLF